LDSRCIIENEIRPIADGYTRIPSVERSRKRVTSDSWKVKIVPTRANPVQNPGNTDQNAQKASREVPAAAFYIRGTRRTIFWQQIFPETADDYLNLKTQGGTMSELVYWIMQGQIKNLREVQTVFHMVLHEMTHEDLDCKWQFPGEAVGAKGSLQRWITASMVYRARQYLAAEAYLQLKRGFARMLMG
jgi:hypothetical protein